MRLPLDSGDGEAKAVEWLDASWLGQPATPMVMSASAVYMGRRGWGLVRMGEAR